MTADPSINPGNLAAQVGTEISLSDDAQPPAGQANERSVGQRAKRGAVIVIFSQFAGQFLRLASNLILTRLLFREHFGMMAMVNIFVSGINMFSDLGIRPSIVQNKRGDDRLFLNTAWTMQVIRGFGVWIVACLLAYPMGYWFYDEMPQLALLLPVAALSAVFMGFQSTKVFTASRHLYLGREMALQLGCNAVGLICMAVIAYFYRSVWALVFGTLIIAALNSAFSHVVYPGPNNRFAWDRDCLGELVRFGKWIFMGTVVLFLANNLDRLVLGKLIDVELLGVYSIAFMLATTPSTIIKRFGNKVVFPAISRKSDMDRGRLTGKLLSSQRQLALVVSVPVLALVSMGDVIIRIGWTDEYLQAGWMTCVLGLGLWVAALRSTTGPALLAFGKPQYAFFGNIGRVVWVSLAAYLCYALLDGPYQLFWFLLAFSLSELPAYAIQAFGTAREQIRLWVQDLMLTGLLMVALAAVLGGRYAMGWGLPFLPTSG